ncbi:MAG: hypothetical protein IKP00_00545 [Victivallales bacterium]|nr:hypothetical protein [Victivallales bacterium]
MSENFISHLEEQIRHHNDLYWQKGTPEISDVEYDRLVETLRSWDPQNPLLKKVEAPAAAGEKIVHTKPMLSLDKVYTKESLRQWMAKVARTQDEPFLVQPKYDGISGKLEHGVLVTRGDGRVGVNITDKLAIIDIESEKRDGILGEIVIRNSAFETMYSHVLTKAGTPFKNSRNAVAGIVANDGVEFYLKQGARLTFVDYETNTHPLKLNEFAEKWDGIQHSIEQLDYPMDGIVVRLQDATYAESLGYTEHHPRGAMALKFTNESVESVVTGFTLSIGKRGTLAATAQIEPRDIGGVTVTNVKVPVIDTLDGQPGILSGGIRVGSKVRVERAGDVIPYLAEVLEVGEAAPTAITDCPVCGSKLVRDGANLFCRNPECGEQQLNQLYFSVMTVGMFGIGKEIVRAIMDITGIRDFLGFMRLDGSLLVGQEGFGKTRITAIMDEIEKARRCTPELFLTALNVPELGKKASEELLKIYSVDEIIGGLTIAQLLRANGIGEVMAKRISEGLVEKQAYIQELRKEFELSQSAPAPEGDAICFTGKSTRPRSEMHQAAREKGLVPVDAVTSTTKYLVVADPNSTSSKVVKARKMGVTILSEEQFWAL